MKGLTWAVTPWPKRCKEKINESLFIVEDRIRYLVLIFAFIYIVAKIAIIAQPAVNSSANYFRNRTVRVFLQKYKNNLTYKLEKFKQMLIKKFRKFFNYLITHSLKCNIH